MCKKFPIYEMEKKKTPILQDEMQGSNKHISVLFRRSYFVNRWISPIIIRIEYANFSLGFPRVTRVKGLDGRARNASTRTRATHASLRDYVTKRRGEVLRYLRRFAGSRAAAGSIDRRIRVCHGNNPSGAPSNSRSSNNANMLVRGSLPWYETRIHMAALARRGGRDAKRGGRVENERDEVCERRGALRWCVG